MRRPLIFAFVASTCLLSAPAWAQSLKIALSSEPTAIDPHYHDLTPNNALAAHIFDGLTKQDEKQKVLPNLATSWENDGQNRWTFKLRQGVTFSNGQPFTADDVIFSFCRTLKNETAIAGSFADITGNFTAVEAPDPHTIVITTKAPDPLLPNFLSGLAILSSSILPHDKLTFDVAKNCGVTGAWPVVGDFNDGKLAIGTGPYKFKSYTKGTSVELERNEKYWGPAEPWASVTFVPVPNAGPRLAGLLAGDYDVIENPAARDVSRIKDDKRFGHVITPSTYQFLPNGMFGALENPPKLAYDPAAAKKLLAEAGYPNGFQVTLSTTNDRYINDSQITQAVAQYLTQVGIRSEVDAMARAIYFPRRAKKEFSVALGGWGSTSGEASSFLRQWPATPDEAKTIGGSNYGG